MHARGARHSENLFPARHFCLTTAIYEQICRKVPYQIRAMATALSVIRDVVHTTPEEPKRYADHAEISNQADHVGDHCVVGEDSKFREQVIPVVNHGVVAANGNPG